MRSRIMPKPRFGRSLTLPGRCADLLKKSLAEIDLVYEING